MIILRAAGKPAELASGALEAFRGSTAEEKRKLLNFVFANLKLMGCKLGYSNQRSSI
jgi:hypothetical protein